MTGDERRALEALRFDWAYVPDDVWRDTSYHVDSLHRDVMRSIVRGVADAAASPDRSPIGVALQGQRGVGKTHLLGLVRAQVQAAGGYFFLVNPHDGEHFWQSVAQSMLDGLLRPTDGPDRQVTAFLRRLADQIELLAGVRAVVVAGNGTELTPRALHSFIAALRRHAPQVGLRCQDTARALVLYGSSDLELQDIGYHYLESLDEGDDPGIRATWGIRRPVRTPVQLVREVSQLLALTGPSVIAVDQIDSLIAQSTRAPGDGVGEEHLLLEQIAGGLMELREVTRRTLTVAACLPESWILIKDQAVDTVADRFRESLQLDRIPDPATGRAIIERRFQGRFAQIGFDPPYPTWPIAECAFAEAWQFTPRGLLQRVDAHIQSCLRGDTVTSLEQLVAGNDSPVTAVPQPPPVGDLTALDTRFAKLRRDADVAAALDPATEDTAMPELLTAGLTAWIAEQGDAGQAYAHDPLPGAKPAVHARLRQTLDERTEDEIHWSFRAITSGNARAVQSRVRAAGTMSGLHQGGAKRKLFLLRNSPWPTGSVTAQVVAAFERDGGVTLPATVEDLRTFAALRELLAERDPHLQPWLLARRPASGTDLFTTAFAGAVPETRPGPVSPAPAAPAAASSALAETAPGGPAIVVGTSVDSRAPVPVELESLRKHIAIFAGSGSGKTVLIRRLIEECALHGVSAIVLDPNNDLARLGDAWPAAPSGWGPDDAGKATDYLAHTDVLVWTPRREAGRPLTLRPLPDFRAVRDDPDEFEAAIDAAVAALAPRASVAGKTIKASHGQAVLRESLRYFAGQGGADLKSFVDLLAELPDGVSALGKADQIAADLSETLTAAMVNDPLFGGEGTPLDPGQLLDPPPGKRARVSVISLVGLPADEQRQSFVNQLQMALFAWIRHHPAGDRPLGGLLVMDEAQAFAPAGALTACTRSTLALASQARKYGLGLIFATQAPKGLHNQIPGNAATQLFGFLNAPAQIEAAREMARAKGSSVVDISRLDTGEFYLAGEGVEFQKVRTPLCLSHHPRSPLTTEEVLQRAHAASA